MLFLRYCFVLILLVATNVTQDISEDFESLDLDDGHNITMWNPFPGITCFILMIVCLLIVYIFTIKYIKIQH